MRVAICMDSSGGGEALTPLLRQFQREFCIPVETELFVGGDALLTEQMGYDLILLDGDLPDCLEVGRRLRERAERCRIILFARDSRSALLGYAIHPEGFLPKPVSYQHLRSALERCRSCWQGEAGTVAITVNRVEVRILWSDIEYIEVRGRTLTIHGRYGTVDSRMSMAQMAAQLEGAPFLMCHRSCLVNLFRVREWERDQLLLDSGASVPVSTDRRERVKEHWRRFLADNPIWAEKAQISDGNS